MFPLCSVFSYLELWASLSGSTLCPTGLTLVSDGLSTYPRSVYSSVSCSLWALNIRCTLDVLSFWLFVNEGKGKQIDSSPKVTSWKHAPSLFGHWSLNNLQKSQARLCVHFVPQPCSIYIKLTHLIYYIKPFKSSCQSGGVFSGHWAVNVVTCNKLYLSDWKRRNVPSPSHPHRWSLVGGGGGIHLSTQTHMQTSGTCAWMITEITEYIAKKEYMKKERIHAWVRTPGHRQAYTHRSFPYAHREDTLVMSLSLALSHTHPHTPS